MEFSDINYILKRKLLLKMPIAGDYPLGFGGLGIHRRDSSNITENCFYRPLATLTIQGSKYSTIGGERYYLREGDFLVSTVDMPAQNYVVDAKDKKPFLSISLYLDRFLITQILSENPSLLSSQAIEARGTGVAKIEADMLAAFLRFFELSETPKKIEYLSSAMLKEIHIRLLLSPLGKYICGINAPNGSGIKLAKVMSYLRENYKRMLNISELSKLAGMSQSTFHRSFKAITGISPLQYQKHLRLYEAQKLMITKNATVSDAAFEVGYDSPSQFSREYKRIFGIPPKKSLVKYF